MVKPNNYGAEKQLVFTADSSAFYRGVTAPQLMLLVVISAIGALCGDGIRYFIARASLIFYLVAFNLILIRRLRVFSLGLLRVYIVGLAAVVVIVALILDLNPWRAIFLPLALIYLGFGLLRIRWFDLLLAVYPSILFVGAYWVIELLTTQERTALDWAGLPVVVAAVGILLLAARRFKEPATLGLNSGSSEISALEFSVGSGPVFVKESNLESSQRMSFLKLAAREIAVELAASLVWKLSVVGVLWAAGFFIAAYFTGQKGASFAITWIGLVVTQFATIAVLLRQKVPRGWQTMALITAVTGWGWWGLALHFPAVGGAFSLGVLCALLIIYGTLPWPSSYAWGLASLASLVLVISVALKIYNPAALLILLGVPFVVRASVLNRLYCVMRGVGLSNIQAGQWGMSSLSLVRGLAWQIAEMLEVRRSLILFGDGRVEIVNGLTLEEVDSDDAYGGGLMQRVGEVSVDHGLIFSRSLGEKLEFTLYDWLKAKAHGFFFVKLRAVISDKEEVLALLVPLQRSLWLYGPERFFRAIVNVAAQVRLILEVSRLRFISSGALSSSQQSLSEGDFELNQVVHYANNLAQDIVIQCENLREALQTSKPSLRSEKSDSSLISPLDQIDLYARMLAAKVTDAKLVRELIKLRDGQRLEQSDIAGIVSEIELYGRERNLRLGASLRIIEEVPEGTGVKVAGREFLETVLRSLLQVAGSRLKGQGAMELRISKEDEYVLFAVSDEGSPVDRRIREMIAEPASNWISADWGEKCVQAALNLARLSGGKFECLVPKDGMSNCLGLYLPACVMSEVDLQAHGQWILLVDDHPEVTTFYARVAQALNLRYVTAASFKEAMSIVAEQGRPRMVITDVHLPDGDGITLLRSLRAKYGEAVPVIIVSGEVEERISAQAMSAGATKYLTKPVNRRKLFSEIRETLSLM